MQSQSQGRSNSAFPDTDVALARKAAIDPENQPAPPASAAIPEDPRERQSRIAAEAYRIAEERGFPANSAVDHWYEAQRRLGYSGLDLAASANGSSSERM
ncbi:MAG: hypothetical protein JWN73_2282 [Betaproteobacteria bacterium]|nr:hypothetical protein [Betaproteobacteria bacterium]